MTWGGELPESVYAQAVKAFRAGRYEEAGEMFSSLGPGYRGARRYADKCAERSAARREDEELRRMVLHAKELLARRRGLEAALGALPGVAVAPGGTGAVIRLEEPALGAAALAGLLTDYVSTFHAPHVTVLCESPAGLAAEERQEHARRAVLLGFSFFHACGLSPERLAVRSVEGRGRLYRLAVGSARPAEAGLGAPVQNVMVHAPNPFLDRDRDRTVALDAGLLDPDRVRRWSVRLLDEGGHLVRRFAGGQDLFVSLAWDGKDEEGADVPPGAFHAFLTAETWAAGVRTDSVVVHVKGGRGAAVKERAPAPAGAARKRWSHLITFPFNGSGPGASARKALENVADSVRSLPGSRLSVEGFADPAETGARALAEARARAVADRLVREHGVAPERLIVRGRPPRQAAGGENLRKAVVFFIE